MSQRSLNLPTNVNGDNYADLVRGKQAKNAYVVRTFQGERDPSSPEFYEGNGRLFFLGNGISTIANAFRTAHETQSPIPGYEILNPHWLRLFVKDGQISPLVNQYIAQIMSPAEQRAFRQLSTKDRIETFLTAYLKKELGDGNYKNFIAGFSERPFSFFDSLIESGLDENTKQAWLLKTISDARDKANEDLTMTILVKRLDNGSVNVIVQVNLKGLVYKSLDDGAETRRHIDKAYMRCQLEKFTDKNGRERFGLRFLNIQTTDPFLKKIVEGKELVTKQELENSLVATQTNPSVKQEPAIPPLSELLGKPDAPKPSASPASSSAAFVRASFNSAEQLKYTSELPKASHVSSKTSSDLDKSSIKQSQSSEKPIVRQDIVQEKEKERIRPESEADTSRPVIPAPPETMLLIDLFAKITEYKKYIEPKLTGFEPRDWNSIAKSAYDHTNPPDMPRAKRLAFKKYHALNLLEDIIQNTNKNQSLPAIIREFSEQLEKSRGVLNQKRHRLDSINIFHSAHGEEVTRELENIINNAAINYLNLKK